MFQLLLGIRAETLAASQSSISQRKWQEKRDGKTRNKTEQIEKEEWETSAE